LKEGGGGAIWREGKFRRKGVIREASFLTAKRGGEKERKTFRILEGGEGLIPEGKCFRGRDTAFKEGEKGRGERKIRFTKKTVL